VAIAAVDFRTPLIDKLVSADIRPQPESYDLVEPDMNAMSKKRQTPPVRRML
jgi:hypothetical protein